MSSRKAIIIFIELSSMYNDNVMSTTIRDLIIKDKSIKRFNCMHFHCAAIHYDFIYDRIEIKLYHPEFIEYPEGFALPYYSLEKARRKFPYLFADTNPLLYRNYKRS